MQDDSLKQRAQALVNKVFNNRLQADTEEYALAVEITQEIYLSAENLPLESWQQHVTDFEETLQTQLNQAQSAPQRSALLRFACLLLQQVASDALIHDFNLPTEAFAYLERGIEQAKAFLAQGETDSVVRDLVLRLYVNAGATYSYQGNLPKAIETYQQGLSHAQAFLEAGETDSVVREGVLKLYANAGSAYSDQGNWPKAIEVVQQSLFQAQAFLEAGETTSGVRELVLKLYFNAGIAYYKQGNLPKAIETYQEGLSHAQAFIEGGETDNGVRGQLLSLYDNHSSTYYSIGQIQSVIPLLPMKGLWSWVALAQFEPNEQNGMLHNWQINLDISPNFPTFTTAFQTLLRHLVLDWHDPNRPHRHFRFIFTETLLAISESLYALTQVESQQPFYTAYQQLVYFAESDWIQTAEEQYRQQQHYRQQLNLLHPQRWWDRFLRWRLQRKIQHIQQLDKQQETVLTQNEWISAVKQLDQSLVKWLKTAILDLLPVVKGRIEGLIDLPAVALGMLLASESLNRNAAPETLLTEWRDHPPWQSAECLQAAFAASHWQTWANNPHQPLLSEWLYSLERNDTVRRLKIAWEIENNPQPILQTWLSALSSDHPTDLLENLPGAWQAAQNAAQVLSSILKVFVNPQFEASIVDEFALATVVLGDIEHQVEWVVETWLQQQNAPNTIDNPLLNTFNTLKYRFDHTVGIVKQFHQPHEETLEKAVHDWAKARLTEILNSQADQPAQFEQQLSEIWTHLERARIGLNSLSLHLAEDWASDLGEKLKKSLKQSIAWLTELIRDGKAPPDDLMWPPLATWLKAFDRSLSKPPTVKQSQQHLAPQEALLQPFFDPIQQRLRVLWLDQQHFELRDLPEDCALQTHWHREETNSVIANWAEILETLRNTNEIVPEAWEQVMASQPVNLFADTLQKWEKTHLLQQLTVIFPAPLGQLPWETLAALEPLLVREVSLAHWLRQRSASSKSEKPIWITYDPRGEEHCMIKESQWVAQHFNTTSEATPSVFEGLYHFANSRQVHLSTHGQFYEHSPIRSYLSLGKGHRLPLWALSAIQTPANLILLSACESNLTGQDTEGLLTPIGIGPTLLAAGAQTVIGTLWAYDGVAALCFSHYFYQLAQAQPDLPWHQIAAQARQQLRQMNYRELDALQKSIKRQLGENVENEDLCDDQIEGKYHRGKSSQSKQPFQALYYWGGFIVAGEVRRRGEIEYS